MHFGSIVLSGVCGALLAVAGAVSAAAEPAAVSRPVPAWTDAEMEAFLLRAKIERTETLLVGVTRSRRATLALDGRSHDAHIQTIDAVKHKHKAKPREDTELYFRDSYRYNLAAYRLDRLLDLHMVPVSVKRSFRGDMAAFTWWVDDVLMMEKDRRAGDVEPPHPRWWQQQVDRRRVFNQLIYNADPNQGNILITRDWKVWLIDFTRAFRRHKTPSNPASLVKIEASLLERLRGLSREQIKSQLRGSLSAGELRPLLARRDAIVEHFDREIERRGAAAVIYETAEP